MTDQLETLLRDTFSGRAATVGAGPPARFAPARRRQVWPAAAAAVTVLGIAAGAAVLHGGDTRGQAGGAVPLACTAALPTPWRDAAAMLGSPSGTLANVRVVTSTGMGIGEAVDPDPAYERIVLVPVHGARRTLWRVRTDHQVLSVDTDGTSAVLAIAPATRSFRPRPAADDVAVIDLRTRRARHVLAGAPIPAGWVVTWASTAIQRGVVYLLARPERATATAGEVVGYTVATGRYAVVGRSAAVGPDPEPVDDPQLVRDVRGVAWRGGAVTQPAAPRGLPPFFSAGGAAGRYLPVFSDGSDVAWQDARDPFLVHWRDGGGAERAMRLDPALPRRYRPELNAVAGPYLLARVAGRATEIVLDVRSRAFAVFGAAGDAALFARGVTRPPNGPPNTAASLLLDTSQLPALRCRTPS